ncbi:MAG: hypothetical protein NTY37_07335 [Methanothrix sp.]|nr:hypothetical protein [Methanothrix sp.]
MFIDNNLNFSFKDRRGSCRAWAWWARSSRRLVYWDDSVSLILDGGVAFAGNLSGRAWGADPMHQVEISWQRIRAMNVEKIYPGHGTVRRLE